MINWQLLISAYGLKNFASSHSESVWEVRNLEHGCEPGCDGRRQGLQTAGLREDLSKVPSIFWVRPRRIEELIPREGGFVAQPAESNLQHVLIGGIHRAACGIRDFDIAASQYEVPKMFQSAFAAAVSATFKHECGA